jgi:hypothetical protein
LQFGFFHITCATRCALSRKKKGRLSFQRTIKVERFAAVSEILLQVLSDRTPTDYDGRPVTLSARFAGLRKEDSPLTEGLGEMVVCNRGIGKKLVIADDAVVSVLALYGV